MVVVDGAMLDAMGCLVGKDDLAAALASHNMPCSAKDT